MIVSAVRCFNRFPQRLAAGAVHDRIQGLHQGESAAAEWLDDLLRRERQHAEHQPAHVLERDVAATRPDQVPRGVGLSGSRFVRLYMARASSRSATCWLRNTRAPTPPLSMLSVKL